MGHLYEDDIHVPIFDGPNFLAACHLAEHAALDGDALVSTESTTGNSFCVLIKPVLDIGELALDVCNNIFTHV